MNKEPSIISSTGKRIKVSNDNLNYLFTLVLVLFLFESFWRLSKSDFNYLQQCIKKKTYIDIFLVDSNIFNNVLFLILLTYLIITYFIKFYKQYKYSDKVAISSIILLSFYIVSRNQSYHQYYLSSIAFFELLKYADLIIIYFLGILVIWIIQLKRKFFSNNPTPLINALLFDKHPDKVEESYGREALAKNISSKVLDTHNPDGSIAVAITGEWGSGKSTFLSIIEKNLKKKTIIVKITPGSTENQKLLVKDFFDIISADLSEYDANISERTDDYVESLLELNDSSLLKTVKKLFNKKRSDSSKARFKRLAHSIKNLPKPLIIFIDDLDRLDKDEIFEVLRLIRNTANFSNVTYIVAFAKEYVLEAIYKNNIHRHENYLEKLFQLEINLPKYETNILPEFLKENLKLRFGSQYNDYFDLITGVPAITESFDNQRDIARFINSFVLIYESLYDSENNVLEVDFFDLFIIELIRVRYDKFYSFLTKRYLDEFDNNYQNIFKDIKDTKGNKIWDKNINELFRILYDINLPNVNQSTISNKEKSGIAFKNKDFRRSYFSYRKLNGEITVNRLKSIINVSNDNHQFLDLLKKENTNHYNLIDVLSNSINSNHTYTFNEYEKLTFAILAIEVSEHNEWYSSSNILRNTEYLNRIDAFFKHAIDTIGKKKPENNQEYDKEDLKKYLLVIIENLKINEFHTEYNLLLIKKNLINLVDFKEIYDEMASAYIEKYILILNINKANLILEFIDFFNSILTDNSKIIFKEKIQKFVFEVCLEYFIIYLDTNIRVDSFLKEIWTNYEGFFRASLNYNQDSNNLKNVELLKQLKNYLSEAESKEEVILSNFRYRFRHDSENFTSIFDAYKDTLK